MIEREIFFHAHTALLAPSSSPHDGAILSPAMANPFSSLHESSADLRFSVDPFLLFPIKTSNCLLPVVQYIISY